MSLKHIPSFTAAIVMLLLPTSALADHDWRIAITEIMYNPDSDESDAQTEWVEIANVSSEPVEITDWRLDDEDEDDWSRFSCTLKPGQVAVLVNSEYVTEDVFRAAWDAAESASTEAEGDAIPYLVIPVEWGSLANSADDTNEILRLLDQHDDIVCEVNYQAGGDWPNVSRPDGPSIYLTDHFATSLNLPEHWARSETGSAGARKNTVTPVFNGEDIGSPGHVEGLNVATTRDVQDDSDDSDADADADANESEDEPESDPEPEPEPDPEPED